MGGWIDFVTFILPIISTSTSSTPAFNKKEMILDDKLGHQFRLSRDLDGDGYDDVFEPVDSAATTVCWRSCRVT